jgi:hypothetical protein
MPRLWDPLWSLSIEEVFYLVFPAFLLLRRNRVLLVFRSRCSVAFADPPLAFAWLELKTWQRVGCKRRELRRSGSHKVDEVDEVKKSLKASFIRLSIWAAFPGKPEALAGQGSVEPGYVDLFALMARSSRGKAGTPYLR